MRSLVLAALIAAPAFASPPDDAAARGLAWLARHQKDDGRWTSSARAGHDFTRLYEPDAAREADGMITAAALLAFLGDGHTPWEGAWRETAARAHAWLAARAGSPLPAPEPADTLQARERSQRRAALARQDRLWTALALLEVLLAADPEGGVERLSEPVRRARVAAAAGPAEAALRLVAADGFLPEASATMDDVALLAAVLHAARGAKREVDREVPEGLRKALERIQTGWTERVVPYRAAEGGEIWFRGAATNAQAMAAGCWLRMRGSWGQMEDLAPALLRARPEWNPYFEIRSPAPHAAEGGSGGAALPAGLAQLAGTWRDGIANEWAWMWQAAAFRLWPGEPAAAWRRGFEPVAVAHQRRGGEEAGSWDPSGPHARVFGREAGTAWMVMALDEGCRLRMGAARWEIKKQEKPPIFETGKAVPVDCEVCGMRILTDTKFAKGEGPRVHYFCSHECQQMWEMDPEAYRDKK